MGREVWYLGGFLEPGEGATTGIECRPTLIDENGTAYVAGYDDAGYTLQAVERDGTTRWTARLGSYLDPNQAGHTLARSGDALYFLDGSARGNRLRGVSMHTGAVVLDEGLPRDLPRTAHIGVYRSGESVGYVTTQGSAWFNLLTRAWTVRHRELPSDEHWWVGVPGWSAAPSGQAIGYWATADTAPGSQFHIEVEGAEGRQWSFTSPVGRNEPGWGHLQQGWVLRAMAMADGDAVVLGGNARTGDLGPWLSRIGPDGAVRWIRPLEAEWSPNPLVRVSADDQIALLESGYCTVPRRDSSWPCARVTVRSGHDGRLARGPAVFSPGPDSFGITPRDLRLVPGRLLASVGDGRGTSAGLVNAVDSPGLGGELETELLTGASSASVPPVHERVWVALGDSYSAGEGLQPFDAGTDVGSPSVNRCHRSGSAYGRVAPAELAGGEVYLASGRRQRLLGWPVHVACSGAVVSDISNANAANAGEEPQVDWVTKSTKVVTLTIGGNDVGFADVLTGCLVTAGVSFRTGLPLVCKPLYARSVEDRIGGLEEPLRNNLRLIRARAHPDARVLLLGYPAIFPARTLTRLECFGIGPSDVAWMHGALGRVNRLLSKVAGQVVGVEFVDTTAVTAEHHACSAGPRWMNGLHFSAAGDLNREFSFHPTELGHRALADRVKQRLSGPPPGSKSVVMGDGASQRVESDLGGAVSASASRASDSGALSGLRGQASFAVSWSIGDVQTTLTDPSGRTLTASSPGVDHDRSEGTETFTVADAQPGTWTVDLVSEQTDGNEADVTVASSFAEPEPPVPTAVFGVSAESARPGDDVTFDASGSFGAESITRWSWDFGDGTTSEGERVEHAYAQAGVYEPTLTVRTASGLSDTFTGVPVTVTAPPAAEARPEPPPATGSAPVAQSGLGPAPPIVIGGKPRRRPRTLVRTVALRRADCTRRRLRVSGSGVTVRAAKPRPRGRCRLTLRISPGARPGKRRLLIKSGKRTIRTTTTITIRN